MEQLQKQIRTLNQTRKKEVEQLQKQIRTQNQTRNKELEQLQKQIRHQNKTISNLRSQLQLYGPMPADELHPPASGDKVVLPPPQYPDDYSVAYPALVANLDKLSGELVHMRQAVAKTRQAVGAQRQIVRAAALTLRQTNAELLQHEKLLAAKEADEANLLARKRYIDQAVTTAQERISTATSVDAVIQVAFTPPMLKTALVVQISALRRLEALVTGKSAVSLPDLNKKIEAAASFAKVLKKQFGNR